MTIEAINDSHDAAETDDAVEAAVTMQIFGFGDGDADLDHTTWSTADEIRARIAAEDAAHDAAWEAAWETAEAIPVSTDEMSRLYFAGRQVVAERLKAGDLADLLAEVTCVTWETLGWTMPDLDPPPTRAELDLDGRAREALVRLAGFGAVGAMADRTDAQTAAEALWLITINQKGPFYMRGAPEGVEACVICEPYRACLGRQIVCTTAKELLAHGVAAVRRCWADIMQIAGLDLRPARVRPTPDMRIGANPLTGGSISVPVSVPEDLLMEEV